MNVNNGLSNADEDYTTKLLNESNRSVTCKSKKFSLNVNYSIKEQNSEKKTYRFKASNADQSQDRISTKHIFDAKDRILVILGKAR